MTMRIGIILPRNISQETLNNIRKDTDLGLLETNNMYINKQLNDDESFFQATSHGIDSSSGIGAYELYTKDLTPIIQIPEKDTRNMMLDGIMKKRKEYYEDATKWVETITKIKKIYKIQKFGIIYFNGYTTSDLIELDIEERITIGLKELSIDALMKMEKNKLVFFE